MKYLIIILMAIGLIGCATTAGPYVTNISSDGKGNLIIEKGVVEYNPWTNTISTKNATTFTIQVVPE